MRLFSPTRRVLSAGISHTWCGIGTNKVLDYLTVKGRRMWSGLGPSALRTSPPHDLASKPSSLFRHASATAVRRSTSFCSWEMMDKHSSMLFAVTDITGSTCPRLVDLPASLLALQDGQTSVSRLPANSLCGEDGSSPPRDSASASVDFLSSFFQQTRLGLADEMWFACLSVCQSSHHVTAAHRVSP